MAKWGEIKCERCAEQDALWEGMERALEESDAREARLERWLAESDTREETLNDRITMLEEHLCLTEERLAKAVEENKLLRDAVYIDDLTVTMQANDKSTALAGIGRALVFLDADMPVEAKTALRATLAELKGQDDE